MQVNPSGVRKSKRLDPDLIEIYFDGSANCTCVPYSVTLGVVVCKGGEEVDRQIQTKFPQKVDSSIAEYLAFQTALEVVVQMEGMRSFRIYGDSRLVIRQMNGEVLMNKYRPYYRFAVNASEKLKNLKVDKDIILVWIPRERNRQADRLTKMSLNV